MQPDDVFIPREIFGTELRPDAVRFSSELSEEAKTAWFVLAMYAGVDDAGYPPLSRLQHLFGCRARAIAPEPVRPFVERDRLLLPGSDTSPRSKQPSFSTCPFRALDHHSDKPRLLIGFSPES